jgi:hypothetical protein
MGTSVDTQVFVKFGWRTAAALNMALYRFQFFVLLLRGPHCKQYTWFGFEGGLEPRKSVVERLEAEKTLESSLPSENAIDKKDREISGTDEKGIETLGKRGDEERGLE